MALPATYQINNAIKSTLGAYGAPYCQNIFTATLAANTEQTLTVPGISAIGNINATTTPQWLAVFTYQPALKVYVAINGTAAVPAGGTFAASTSSLLPTARILNTGDVIHVIAPAITDVSIELYYIQEG